MGPLLLLSGGRFLFAMQRMADQFVFGRESRSN
jgi:hypothetical protein